MTDPYTAVSTDGIYNIASTIAGQEGLVLASGAADNGVVAVVTSLTSGTTSRRLDIYTRDPATALWTNAYSRNASYPQHATCAMSDDGNVVAFGYANSSGAPAGQVLVLQNTGSGWAERGAVIDNPFGNGGFAFGGSLAINGNGTRIAVGSAPANTSSVTTEVYVYGYDQITQTWSQVGDTLSGQSWFGRELRMNQVGDVIAVGQATTSATTGPRVYTLDVANNVWNAKGQVFPQGTGPNGYYAGSSIALSPDGNSFAIGVPRNTLYMPPGGQTSPFYMGQVTAYTYNTASSQWVMKGDVVYGDSYIGDGWTTFSGGQLGSSVIINNGATKMVCGSPSYTSQANDNNSGAVISYDYSSGSSSWVKGLVIRPGIANYGFGYALSANYAMTAVSVINESGGSVVGDNRLNLYEIGNALTDPQWYFSDFANAIALPMSSYIFTNMAVSGDGKTIAVGMISYTPSDSNPDVGEPRAYAAAYRTNAAGQWTKLGGNIAVLDIQPPYIAPVITRASFDSRDDMDLVLSLSYDGNTLVTSTATNASNIGTGIGVYLYEGGGWVFKTGGSTSGAGTYGIDIGSSGVDVAYGIIDMSTRFGRVNIGTLNYSLPSGYSPLVGGPTIRANGIVGFNGITESNADNPNTSVWFGRSVKTSSNGKTIAIGGYCTETGKGYPVYVYDLTDYYTNVQSANWNVDFKKGTLPLTNGPQDVLGERVLWLSGDGDKLAVGYPRANNSKGYVVVFVYNPATKVWVQRGSVVNGTQDGEMFGASLTLNQDATIMVVGSPSYAVSGTASVGKVTVYEYNASSSPAWSPTSLSTKAGTGADNAFGMEVVSNDDLTLLAVARNNDANLVTTYSRLNVEINFTTAADPITLMRYQPIPTGNYLSSVTYGPFSSKTFPNSDVIVTGFPTSTDSPGDSLVTYAVPNNGLTTDVATGVHLATDTKTIRVSSSIYIAPICFYAGSKVLTDQGEVEIQDIVPHKHSIGNLLVCDVTKVINSDSTMTFIRKDALATNVPYCDTYVTNKHKVLYDNSCKMVPAKDLVELVQDHKKVSLVQYSGMPVYNVVLMEPSTMVVNGMTCETLHPRNVMYMRIKIREELATCSDPKRIVELKEQDNAIVEAVSRHLVNGE